MAYYRVVMNAHPTAEETSASLAATNTDPVLITLFDDELAPLEEDEAAAIGSRQTPRLAEIRADMAVIKQKINARLAELKLAPLYDL